MGTMITKVLTGEDLAPEKRQTRDECLGYLLDHILDSNAYVRSKVLSTWQRLCSEGAVPLSKQIALLKATVLRLEDKSANVRKQALQLLRAILQSNPFTSQVSSCLIFARESRIVKAGFRSVHIIILKVYNFPFLTCYF